MRELKYFKFWCYKVLPLVYDDSLSYYEVLCKVVKYINELIEQDQIFGQELDALRADLNQVQEWINNYDTEFAKKIIEKYLATMIFVEISNAGYFVYYIPESWSEITFNTTGYDTTIAGVDDGRLVLSY